MISYMNVASFLKVNWYKGLFMFDGRFRPVPLTQTFIGVKKPFGFLQQLRDMEEVCYEKVLKNVKEGHQVKEQGAVKWVGLYYLLFCV